MRIFSINIIFPLLIVIVLTGCGKQGYDSSHVHKDAFIATLTETGELQAVNSHIITVPFYSWEFGRAKIIYLEKEGTMVQKKDVVAKLDTTIFIRELGEKQQEYAIARADYQKLLAQQATARKDMQSAIQSNQAALESAIIDTQRVQFEPVNKQHISHLNYLKAKKRFAFSRQKYELLLKIQAEEKRIQEGKIFELNADMQKALTYMKRFTVRAPSNGMIEYRSDRRTRQKVKIGDEKWPGQDFLGLPDLSRIKVKTAVHESDIYKIKKGQPVSVRLDAYPQKTFTGQVTFIAVICHKKEDESNIKEFDVEILLNETDIILKPGMTVSCDIEVANLKEVLFVEHAYIAQEGSRYFVYKKRGAGTLRVPVEPGPKNARWVVVQGDLKKGDRLILPENSRIKSNMKE